MTRIYRMAFREIEAAIQNLFSVVRVIRG